MFGNFLYEWHKDINCLKFVWKLKHIHSVKDAFPFHSPTFCTISWNKTIPSLSWIHTRTQAFFLSHCRMRISVFWGQERLTDRSISKRYLKSDIATRVEKSSTSRAIHARDTGFYWPSENALHERFIVVALESEWKRYSSSQSDKKMLAFEYEFSFTLWIYFNPHTHRQYLYIMWCDHAK